MIIRQALYLLGSFGIVLFGVVQYSAYISRGAAADHGYALLSNFPPHMLQYVVSVCSIKMSLVLLRLKVLNPESVCISAFSGLE